ncbi:MAG: HAMP domain-containing protein, partial [Leptonema sp. (in: Bacteria)]|nr:HAMP domain-containing protein [Leptonema sp. (in: bacteria)]
MLQIKQKSKSTIDLGIAFFWFMFFYLGYFIAAAIYTPAAANHRFLTAGFILPGFLQITQWVLRYPENTHPRFQKVLLWTQWAVAIVITGAFYVKTRGVVIKFWPNGHYFDFDAETISKIVAIFIMVYLFIFIFTSIWKAVIIKNKRSRYAIIGVLISIIIGAMVPSILNTMSRDGSVDRSLYLNSLVLMSIIAFFGITIIFMNTTDDKTTFMAKIVGISMVTFLILFQGMAAISMEDRENEYDQIQLQYLIRAVEGGAIEPNMAYLYVHNTKSNTGELKYSHKNYFDSPSENLIDFRYAEIEYQNTALYEELKRLDPNQITEGLNKLLAKTPAEFGGYKQSLEQFLMSGDFQLNPSADALFSEIDRLNKIIFINKNKLSFLSDATFRTEAIKYIDKSKDPTFAPFGQLVKHEIEARTDLEGEDLKNKVFEFLAPFKAQYTRHYRFSRDGLHHFIAYIVYVPETQTIYEGGYFYRDYRSFIHISAFKQIVLLAGVLFVLLVIFPLFFRGSLINPLTELLDGVTKVNQGDLSVVVPVHVQDEIGFLAGSFNSMVKSIKDAQAKLQDYANNLEEMVKARTAELNATLEEVNKLKVQQDGDYYLTSLLMSPLQLNVNKSERIQTNFKIVQKKKFEFRNKMADLGGDICITGNLRMGTKDNYKRYLVAMNGDAMG